MLERLALSRGVLVHPSAYGEDYSLLRNVLARQPQPSRRDRHSRQSRDDACPTARRRRSCCALQSSLGCRNEFRRQRVVRGPRSHDQTALADARMHAELWTDCKVLPAIAVRAAPVPVSRGGRPHGRFRLRGRRRRRRLSRVALAARERTRLGEAMRVPQHAQGAEHRARATLSRQDARRQSVAARVGQRLAAPEREAGA